MKIKTNKPKNTFPGDTFLRIDAHLSDKRIMPIMGIYKQYGLWHNDINGRTFKTITEAKQYAIEIFETFETWNIGNMKGENHANLWIMLQERLCYEH